MRKKFMAVIATFLFFVPFSYAGGSSESAKPAQQKEQIAATPAQVPYFTGDGGKGIRLAVLEPSVNEGSRGAGNRLYGGGL